MGTVYGRLACARARAIAATDHLGRRPYTVTVVVLRWTGGGPGRGEPVVDQRIELEPIPLVTGLDQLRAVMEEHGHTETGTVVVSEIAPQHARENLLGIDADGRKLSSEYEIIWEIEYWPTNEGDTPVSRRFHIVGHPERDGIKGWRVVLTRADVDRDRFGDYQ